MEARTHPLPFAGGSFDPLRGELRVGGRKARLRPRSAAVLAVLLEERGQVVPREALMRQVWPDAVVTDDSLAQCIKEIRRALGPAADCIRTLPRVGYAFAEAEAAAEAPEAETMVGEPATQEAAQAALAPAAATGMAGATGAAPAAAGAGAQRPLAPVAGAAEAPGDPALVLREADAVPTAEASPSPASSLRAARLRWLLGGFALALAALVALGVSVRPLGREAPRFSIAVLPLQLSGDGATRDALAEAVVDRLGSELMSIPGSFVLGRGAAERYRGGPQDARRVGRELGVRYVVEGSLQRAGPRALLSLRLVEAQAGEVVWSLREEGLLADPGALPPALTTRVARELHLVLLADDAARAGHHPAASPAQTLVLAQARLREDPEHAPAWMWAATAHLRLGNYAAAVADAETALRLATPDDPNQGLYYGALARARFFNGDAPGALDAGEKAMQAPGGNRYAALVVSAAAMDLGAVEKGQRVMAEFLARNAGFSLNALHEKTGDAGSNPGEAERRYWNLLLAAGLPGR